MLDRRVAGRLLLSMGCPVGRVVPSTLADPAHAPARLQCLPAAKAPAAQAGHAGAVSHVSRQGGAPVGGRVPAPLDATSPAPMVGGEGARRAAESEGQQRAILSEPTLRVLCHYGCGDSCAGGGWTSWSSWLDSELAMPSVWSARQRPLRYVCLSTEEAGAGDDADADEGEPGRRRCRRA